MSYFEDRSLSIEQSIELLPPDFAPVEILDRKRQLADSSKGKIALRSSQKYFPNFWTISYRPELLETEIKFLVVALDFSGILVVPSEIFLEFGRKHAASKLKNVRQTIKIKKVDEHIVLYEPGAPLEDLAQYFIPAHG